MKQDFAGLTTGSIKNVENIELTNSSNANLAFNATKIEGATKYVVTDAVDKNTTITNVASLANVELSGTADTADTTLTVGYAATSTVATGSQTDVQNLKVTNQGSANTAAADAATNAKFLSVDIDKVETLAITTAGTANSLSLAASADVKTVTVTGEGKTEIKDLSNTTTSLTVSGTGATDVNSVGTGLTSFDGSANTGNVTANLNNAAAASLTTVKTGAGNDKVTLSLDDLTSNATIAGGAGADTLLVDEFKTTKQITMSGIETVKLNTVTAIGGAAAIFSGTNVTDLANIEVKGSNAGTALAGNVQFVNMGAKDLTVTTLGAVTGSKISADNSGAITVNMNKSADTVVTTEAASTVDLDFANASSLTANVNEYQNYNGDITTGSTGAVKLNVASKLVNSAETTKFTGTLTANSASSVTIDATGGLDNTTAGNGVDIKAAKATTVTITAGANSASAVNLAAEKATTLNVTAGVKGLDMEGVGGTTNLDKVQTATLKTDGHLDFTGVDLKDATDITVSGSNAKSKLTLDTLGTTDITHDVKLTATGLTSGLTTGNIDSKTGKITLDVSGVTAGATFGTITTTGDVSINAENLGGALTTTGAITGNNVTINAQNALGVMTISDDISNGLDGTADVTAKTSVTYTGTNLNNNGIDIATHADSTAFTATLNGGAKNETFTIAGNTKQTGITVTGNLGAGTNLVTTTLANSTATAQTVDLSGLTSSATAGDSTGTTATNYETSTVMKADLDANLTFKGSVKDDLVELAGTYTGTISITDATSTDKDMLHLSGATNTSKLTISGIEGITVGGTSSINASAISGQAIAITNTAAVLTLNGKADVNDTIDLSNITATADTLTVNGDTGNDTIIGLKTGGGTYNGGNGDDTITVSQGINTINGGAGNDTITLGSGADDVVLGLLTGTLDTIIGFNTAADKLVINNAAVDGSEVAITAAGVAGALATDTTTVIAQTVGAAASLTTLGTATIADFTNMTQVAAFLAEKFTVAGNNEVASVVMNNGTNSYVYVVDASAGAANGTIDAAEVTLIGVVNSAVVLAAHVDQA
ncbi:hypothetical protein NG767_11190 [Aliarcobacter cryaerophilus]|uniref:beta strand repeat-containing protein n=1 Tax=Aliarcobacter cryaerophilus TaxID=28198 RepID=UPI003DA51CAD